jgi:hypothetical protein
VSILGTWINGLRRVAAAPALLVLLWTTTVVLTLPSTLLLDNALRTQLGSSLEADQAANGVNYDWMREFQASSSPLARTVRADVIGFAAVMDNASALADATERPTVVVATGAVYVVLLSLLSAGVVRRLAGGRPLHASGFLATCGAFAVRMFRLSLLSAIVYSVLFGAFHQWLFDDLFTQLTRETTVERTAFLVRVASYVLFFCLVAAFNVLFDFARVRMVVEGRHSVVAAIAASGRFIRTHTKFALGVYALNVAAFAFVIGLYAAVAPGAGGSGWTMWGGLVVSQAYIAARLVVKLAFWASEIAAVQAKLAYDGFIRTSVEAEQTPQ